MARTAREGSAGEYISHFNGVRLRLTGSGNLDVTIYSLDDVKSFTPGSPLIMADPTDREPLKKLSLMTQRASIEFSTDEINEYFRINRIIIFSRPVFANFPG